MVSTLPDGELEFKVFIPTARTVEVVGSFTGWRDRPLALSSDGSGWWTGRTAVPPGDHDFQYRIDGEGWMADFAAHGVRLNPFGQWVSRLAVARRAA
ncbi:MAG: glycogen-binding domain-containing protein [Planctomycetota bacterium]|nr:glycogen-binding domain-containing protein [Planctomycetota bacterium]